MIAFTLLLPFSSPRRLSRCTRALYHRVLSAAQCTCPYHLLNNILLLHVMCSPHKTSPASHRKGKGYPAAAAAGAAGAVGARYPSLFELISPLLVLIPCSQQRAAKLTRTETNARRRAQRAPTTRSYLYSSPVTGEPGKAARMGKSRPPRSDGKNEGRRTARDQSPANTTNSG